MSIERFSLDSNILVYALDNMAGLKHELAAEIVDRAATRDCWLTLQALSEFYAAVTRKGIVPRVEAAAQVEDWLTLFPTLAASSRPVRAALAHATAGRASYWDALLAETGGEGGCAVVLSEDIADGARMGTAIIRHPFCDDGLSPACLEVLGLG